MKEIIGELNAVLSSFTPKFRLLGEEEFTAKPLADKWSKKEVLGHLIDSAHNNLRRCFVCGQYEKTPPKITYDQDFWVRANQYQYTEKNNLIQLWVLMNQQIIAILGNMPSANYNLNCDTGKTDEALHSIQWLAEDYVKHMKHHLNQIFPASF